jgi:hydrogenase nickel incorporation protein HypB
MTEIRLLKKVLASNDALAEEHRALLDQHHILALNLMSGPGSGKTSLVEATIDRIRDRTRIFVIEGDIKGDLDARRVAKKGVGCLQINTQTECHLDAFMLSQAYPKIDLRQIDLLLIENVGNLVCPAEFNLGTHYNVMLLSTPEGSDKPEKYPLMFSKADILLINKIDLTPYVNFDFEGLARALKRLKPGLPIMKISCKTGEGLDEWLGWLSSKLQPKRR